jgi:GT2 family glycosyltransferase
LVSPDWYRNLFELWESSDENIHAIVGKMEIFEPTTQLRKFMARHNPFLPLPLSFSRNNSLSKKIIAYIIGKKDISAGYISGFSNGNASFRKQSLEKVGGYDTRYRLGAEDEDIAAKLQKSFGNHAIYYDPSVKVFHDSTYSVKNIVVRNYKYGKSAAFRFSLEKSKPLILPIPVILVLLVLSSFIFENTDLIYIILLTIPILYVFRIKERKFIFDGYLILITEISHLAGFIFASLQLGSKLFKR